MINAEGQEAVETVISSVIQESQDEQPLTEAQKAIKESSQLDQLDLQIIVEQNQRDAELIDGRGAEVE